MVVLIRGNILKSCRNEMNHMKTVIDERYDIATAAGRKGIRTARSIKKTGTGLYTNWTIKG